MASEKMYFEAVILSLLLRVGVLNGIASSLTLQNSLYLTNDKKLESLNLAYHCKGNSLIYCPPWTYCNTSDGTCKCFRKSGDAIKCDSNKNQGKILSCYCLTDNEYMNVTEVGMCLYNCDYLGKGKLNIDVDYSSLTDNRSDLNHNMCGRYNRTGTLCGKCINNTYLRAYSYDLTCTSCGSIFLNIVKYVLVAYVPLTLFCITIMMLRLNIASSQIQGFVFFSQIVSSPIVARQILTFLEPNQNYIPFKMAQIFGTIYGIWNLDFFRFLPLNICFQAHSLTILFLDFFVALYPLLLMAMIYMLTLCYDSNITLILKISKPFKSVIELFLNNWDVKTSTVDAFVTFFFLSNVKFLSLCFDLLVPVNVCEISEKGTCKWALFYDASVQYFSREHIPYAVLAIIVLVVFVIAPILMLIVYPFAICQKCLGFLPNRWQLVLHMVMDSLQGCYKNGTEVGTRDCRWFSAVSFTVRFMIFNVYAAVILSSCLPFCITILVFAVILTIIVDPYKPQFKHYSLHHNVFLLFLACVITCTLGLDYNTFVMASLYVVLGMIGLTSLFYVSTLILKWMITRRKFWFPL